MFAFSQIVAGGANPMQVANEMEKELNKPKPKTIGGIDEDTAVAAYAEFMSSGGSFEEDPAKLAAAKAKKDKEAKASAELKELEGNDSTSAFAALVTAQTIEGKAETFKGSGQDEEEEQKKKKKLKIKVKVKKQDDAIVQTEEESHPAAPIQIEETPAPVEPPKKKLIIKPKKKKTEEAVKKPKKISQLKKKKVAFDDPKPLPEPVKDEASPDAPVELSPDDKAADAQADALLDQIKDVAANIKTAGVDGDPDAQTKALDMLAKISLLQTGSQIRVDPEADLAMEYLAAQFPDDYEKEPVVKKVEPVLSEEEQLKLDSKTTVNYAKDVLNDA